MGVIITHRKREVDVFAPFECVELLVARDGCRWSLRQDGKIVGHTDRLILKDALVRRVNDGSGLRLLVDGLIHHGPEETPRDLGYPEVQGTWSGRRYPFALLWHDGVQLWLNPQGLT